MSEKDSPVAGCSVHSPQSTVHSPPSQRKESYDSEGKNSAAAVQHSRGVEAAGMSDKEVDFGRLRKLRVDSKWNQLTGEERDRLESWLFEENLGYAKIVARVKAEFDIETTTTSVYRYYQRRARERKAEELVETQLAADQLNGLAVDASSLRTAAVKLVGNAAVKLACEKPEDLEQLAALTELLLEAEQNDLRRGRLEFAQRCFDYEAIVATVQEIPWIRAYMQAVVDNKSLSSDEKSKKVEAMLFHWVKEVKAGHVK